MTRINIGVLIMVLFILSACDQQSDKNNVIPDDLAGKKEFLKERKAELKSLEKEIKQLSAQIDEMDPDKEVKKRLVTVEPIQRKSFNKYITTQGTVVSEDVVKVSSETGGRIVSLRVKEGDYVKRGQVVAKVDMATTQNQIEELKTSLTLATSVYEKQKRLWDQNIGTEVQYLQAKNNKERLEKSIATLNSQTAKAYVYAPISGLVDMEYLQSGEVAAPGMPIIQLLNTRKMKIVADLPENNLGVVKKGDWVELTIPALNKNLKAKVSMIGRRIDPANRTFKVEVVLDNRKGEYKPNLLAEMKIVESEVKNAIVVPTALIQDEISGKKYVYVSAESMEGNIVMKKYVVPGESNDSDTMIEEGLHGEEQLIVDGARIVTENQPIEIKKEEVKS